MSDLVSQNLNMIFKTPKGETVHALKATVARYGKTIGEEAIQLHGGIGMTDELNIGHYVKRLMMINTAFGDGDYHQKKFNQISYMS